MTAQSCLRLCMHEKGPIAQYARRYLCTSIPCWCLFYFHLTKGERRRERERAETPTRCLNGMYPLPHMQIKHFFVLKYDVFRWSEQPLSLPFSLILAGSSSALLWLSFAWGITSLPGTKSSPRFCLSFLCGTLVFWGQMTHKYQIVPYFFDRTNVWVKPLRLYSESWYLAWPIQDGQTTLRVFGLWEEARGGRSTPKGPRWDWSENLCLMMQ